MARVETSALAGSETPVLVRNWRRVIDIGIPSDVSQTGVNISAFAASLEGRQCAQTLRVRAAQTSIPIRHGSRPARNESTSARLRRLRVTVAPLLLAKNLGFPSIGPFLAPARVNLPRTVTRRRPRSHHLPRLGLTRRAGRGTYSLAGQACTKSKHEGRFYGQDQGIRREPQGHDGSY
jgi:hypothetical protein